MVSRAVSDHFEGLGDIVRLYGREPDPNHPHGYMILAVFRASGNRMDYYGLDMSEAYSVGEAIEEVECGFRRLSERGGRLAD